MDLWIYSQDKKYLQEIKGVKNNKSSIWGYSYTDTGILLGTYESEERAMEVLEEIKSIICINCGFVLYSNIGEFPNNYNKEYNLVPVFEMPEK